MSECPFMLDGLHCDIKFHSGDSAGFKECVGKNNCPVITSIVRSGDLSEYHRGLFQGFTKGIRFAFALLKEENEFRPTTKLHSRRDNFPEKC